MSQVKNIFVYLIVGFVVGAIFGLLIGWPSTPHMQYLKADWPYYVSLAGAVGGVVCGLALSILDRNNTFSVFLGSILGATLGFLVVWLSTSLPASLDNGWLLFVIGGGISGVFINLLNLPHNIEMLVHRIISQRIKPNNNRLPVVMGVILGGFVGSGLTVVIITIYILLTVDTFRNTFSYVRYYYFFIPIGALLGVIYAHKRSLSNKNIDLGMLSFNRGISSGILIGIFIAISSTMYVLVDWLIMGMASSLSSVFIHIAVTIVVVTIIMVGIIPFCVCISMISESLLAKFRRVRAIVISPT